MDEIRLASRLSLPNGNSTFFLARQSTLRALNPVYITGKGIPMVCFSSGTKRGLYSLLVWCYHYPLLFRNTFIRVFFVLLIRPLYYQRRAGHPSSCRIALMIQACDLAFLCPNEAN